MGTCILGLIIFIYFRAFTCLNCSSLKDEDTDVLESAVNDTMTWCERVVLPHLSSSTSSTMTVPKSRNQRKRKCNQSLVPCDESVICDLADGVVKVCDVYMCACCYMYNKQVIYHCSGNRLYDEMEVYT